MRNSVAYNTSVKYAFLSLYLTVPLLFVWYMLNVAGQPLACLCSPLEGIVGINLETSNSQRFLDWYTLSHLVYGALYLYVIKLLRVKMPMRAQLLSLLLLSVGLEMIEHTEYVMQHFRTTTISTSYYGDTVINSLGDIFAALFGFWLATKIRWQLLLVLILAIETASLLIIHDSLMLNILSFILPREWMFVLYDYL